MDQNNFLILKNLVNELNLTNSTLDKLSILSKSEYNIEFIKKYLKAIYNPFKQYYITSSNLKKRQDLIDIHCKYENIFDLLDDLSLRKITGHSAISQINSFINLHPGYEEFIYNLFDRNLKIRMSEKLINKVFPDLIPTFEVALANKYDDYKNKINWNDGWYASTKLDGCRCIVIIDNIKNIKIFSRSGKEFLTLDVLKKEIAKLNVQDIVLDGEICIVDENGKEDFQAILKEYNKKDHTIKNPKLLLFDCIALNDFENKKGNTIFSDRIKLLNNIINIGYNNSISKNIIEVLSQIKINNNEELQKLRDEASEKGWEGIMIRKDIGYEGKRSNNLLKCKLFQDAEYIVNDIEIGPFRVINNGKEEVEEVMTNVFIEHKGFKVSVGSGFSLEERRKYKENPNDIIGKEITVSYFEETLNQQGTISLRFPTVKAIYENERSI